MLNRAGKVDLTGLTHLDCFYQVSIQLETGAVRCLEGAAECAADKVASSLAPQNARVSSWLQSPEQAEQHEKWPLLVDPQTGQEVRIIF